MNLVSRIAKLERTIPIPPPPPEPDPNRPGLAALTSAERSELEAIVDDVGMTPDGKLNLDECSSKELKRLLILSQKIEGIPPEPDPTYPHWEECKRYDDARDDEQHAQIVAKRQAKKLVEIHEKFPVDKGHQKA